jgi:uncharacterized RDD family membrane protein YckC
MDIDTSQASSPGLMRRLAALLYDGVLLFGVLLLAAGLVVVPYMSLVGGAFPNHAWWFRAWLVAVVAGFYAYFWTHGGQTLGMSAWRLRLIRADGGNPNVADALRRLVCTALYLAPAVALIRIGAGREAQVLTGWIWWAVAIGPAALGLLWVSIDRDGLAWHDRWSRTRLVLVAKR